MMPKTKNELKNIPAKYGILEYGDIIKESDEYYNNFKDKWLPVMKEFIGQEWCSDESKAVRRKF